MANDEIKIRSIKETGFKLDPDDDIFNYQKELTEKLDKTGSEFNQEVINEIVLWKVNRYAKVKKQTLSKINSINPQARIIDKELTTEILTDLLSDSTKGVQLAMASTILRFKNPNIYQIIDQRVVSSPKNSAS